MTSDISIQQADHGKGVSTPSRILCRDVVFGLVDGGEIENEESGW